MKDALEALQAEKVALKRRQARLAAEKQAWKDEREALAAEFENGLRGSRGKENKAALKVWVIDVWVI